MKKQLVTIISDGEFDELVSTTYGRVYHFQQQDDCKERQTVYVTVPCPHPCDFENDTVPEVVNGEKMGVSFAAWLARDPQQPLEGDDTNYPWRLAMFWERNFYPHVDMVLNDLYEKGLLEAGEYGIKIDW